MIRAFAGMVHLRCPRVVPIPRSMGARGSTAGGPGPPVDAGPREPHAPSLARTAATSSLVAVFLRAASLVLSLVIARTLDPVEVGLLGIAIMMAGIISMMTQYSETAAVISRADCSHEEAALVAVTIRLVTASLLVTVLVLAESSATRILAGRVAAVLLASLTRIMLLAVLLEIAASYPRVLLQRRLDLGYLIGANAVQILSHLVLTLLVALAGGGVVEFALANVTSVGLLCLFLWARVISRPPHRGFELPARSLWRDMLVGTWRAFQGGIGGFLAGRVDNLIVTSTIGPRPMSFYSMAWNATRTPVTLLGEALVFTIVSNARRAVAPLQVLDRLRRSVQHSYLIAAPALLGLLVTADSLTMVVLGLKWMPVIVPLRIMCLSALLSPLAYCAGAVLTGLGRADRILPGTGAQILVLVTILAPAARHWGIAGAAGVDCLASLTLVLVVLCEVRRLLAIPLRPVLGGVVLPVLASLPGALLAAAVGSGEPSGLEKLLLQAALMASLYLGAMYALGGRTLLRESAAVLMGAVRRPPG